VTVPVIEGCTAQWKANVPTLGKARVKVSPVAMIPLSNVLSSAVTVCGASPEFFQRIDDPRATVIASGANAKSTIFAPTALLVGAGLAVRAGVGRGARVGVGAGLAVGRAVAVATGARVGAGVGRAVGAGVAGC